MTTILNEFSEPHVETGEWGIETIYFRHRQLFLNDAIRDSKLIYLRAAGHTETTGAYFVEHERALTHHLFEYVLSGKGYIEQNGAVYPLRAGDFCLIRAGDSYKYYADEEDPYIKIWFSASGAFLEKMFDAFKVDEPVYVTNYDMSQHFQRLFDLLIEEGHKDLAIMHALLDVFYRACGTKQRVHQMSHAAKIKYYIDRDICSCSVESIASRFNYSRRHLGRIFREEYGITMSHYILKQRLAIAERMLVENECAVADVSAHLGFCNQNHFSTIFKKEHGMTPSEYRARYALPIAVDKNALKNKGKRSKKRTCSSPSENRSRRKK